MQLLMAILAAVIGLAFCFGGWRFFLLLLPIWGFVVGFGLGTEVMRNLFGDGTFATITSWIVGFVFAVVFAALAYLYYYAAIAILAGMVGYAIGASAWGIIGNEQGLIAFLIGLAVGVVFAIGVLALNVPRLLVIVLTGLGGAAVVLEGWFLLIKQAPDGQHDLVDGRAGDQGQLVLPDRVGPPRGGRDRGPAACPGARSGHVRVRQHLVPLQLSSRRGTRHRWVPHPGPGVSRS